MRALLRPVILLEQAMDLSDRIVVLTGAGISADSGVPTFRDSGGIWAKYHYRDVATPEGFAANPNLLHEFYNLRRAGLPTVQPNPAHDALAQLAQAKREAGGCLTLVTQNVDDLHERGGSKSVWHMHGELTKARCTSCGTVREWADALSVTVSCPDCAERGTLRPHIVWFGEVPMLMEEIAEAVAEADLFVSIGTSGSVYPAAGFVGEAKSLGIPCMEINLEPSENAHLFDEAFYGPAAEQVPVFVGRLMSAVSR
nr:NAD-dependent deacylase [Parvularcula sp. IMCC14364]